MANALKKITWNGIEYFVDSRLYELREVARPFISISFDDLPEEVIDCLNEQEENNYDHYVIINTCTHSDLKDRIGGWLNSIGL